MQKTNWRTVAFSALAALAVLAIVRFSDVASGSSATDNNGDLIAVTGDYGNGTSILYVIDTKTRNLAAYRSLNGSSIEFVGARRILHDLKLINWHDRTGEGMTPLELEKSYSKYIDGKAPTPIPSKVDAAATPATSDEPAKEKK